VAQVIELLQELPLNISLHLNSLIHLSEQLSCGLLHADGDQLSSF
jgi:hypothetical protein